MPRSYQPVEFNSFIAGLVSEASPLNFPPNASLDEENFALNRNGSRTRRLGFDLEDNYISIDSGQTLPINQDPVMSSYLWKNVGGDSRRTFVVIQIENRIHFFDSSITPISSGLVGTWDYDNSQQIVRFSYAAVDGKLIVATGRKDIDVFTYDSDTNFSILSKRLLVRDLFGVTDIAASSP